jgi:hypothetical protein
MLDNFEGTKSCSQFLTLLSSSFPDDESNLLLEQVCCDLSAPQIMREKKFRNCLQVTRESGHLFLAGRAFVCISRTRKMAARRFDILSFVIPAVVL